MFAWIKRLIRLTAGEAPMETSQSRKIRALYAESRRFSRAYEVPAYLRRAQH